MILVTVGTHEQPFNRLIRYIDEMKRNGLEEEVIMQIGYSTYEPEYCVWKRFFSYDEMSKLIDNAHIVITHGGPSSFISVLQTGKIPVIVPRQKKYREHINNHQVEFCKSVYQRYRNIIVVIDIEKLGVILNNYETIKQKMGVGGFHHNSTFVKGFITEVESLV